MPECGACKWLKFGDAGERTVPSVATSVICKYLNANIGILRYAVFQSSQGANRCPRAEQFDLIHPF